MARIIDRVRRAAAAFAMAVYLGRFDRLFEDHTIFAGVTYTEAHVTLTGMLVVVGRARRRRGSSRSSTPSRRRSCAGWSPPSFPPSSATSVVGDLGWYVQQLHGQAERARARAAVHRAQHRDDARRRTRLNRVAQRPFPADRASTPSTPRTIRTTLAEHPAVGLARAAGHAAPDSGNPHLLRLSRHRHRPLLDRRHGRGR